MFPPMLKPRESWTFVQCNKAFPTVFYYCNIREGQSEEQGHGEE